MKTKEHVAAADRPMTRLALRLIVGVLIALAVLPPLLVAGAGWAVEHPFAGTAALAAGRPLLPTVLLVALGSTLLALGCWAFVLRRPVRALRLAEQRLNAMARRDNLTGLLNREGMRQALQQAFARSQQSRRKVGVLVIDVDRFRLINDSLGQPAGNELLRSVAARIRGVVRESDAVARVGGDQFAVLVEGSAGPPALEVMARNLLRAFERAHQIGGRSAIASLSIGVAVASGDGDTADGLLKCAEVALRGAKAAGGARHCVFEPNMHIDDERRLEMDLHLRQALHNGEFRLVFQPIMDARGERVLGVESLIRWADPARGTVSPADFIPLLEQTGLIVTVGNWVLRESCRQALTWLARGHAALVLSVNVSPRQFVEPDFANTVAAILHETGFPPSRLQLEVTEGLLLDPTPEGLNKMSMLAGLGVRLAVDDFGMGYSSLAYLKTFPLHTLKIDRVFVRDLLQQERDTAIVRAIVELGHSLGLHVTAEGVENEDQQQALKALGCDSLQGFHFARPFGATEMQAMLDAQATIDEADSPPSGWSQTMSAVLTVV